MSAATVVLVVDDEESMRYFLRRTLTREGYEVVEAADGPAALASAARQPPDVALVDIRMPGMDGVAVMRALRDAHRRLPVVLMTAYGSVDNALAAMKHGAADYVTKPFRVDAIRTTIAKALAERGGRGRPPTLRDVERGPPPTVDATTAAASAGVPDPARERVVPRGLTAYLREQVAERRLPFPGETASGDLGLRDVARLAELVYIDEMLRLTAGNVSRAAEIARITRPNMHRKIVDLGLSAGDYRRAGSTSPGSQPHRGGGEIS